MSNPYRAGRVGAAAVGAIADRAATRIMEISAPQAVCLDPDGRVTVEPVSSAVEEDIVGTYTRDPGLLALFRTIREDLQFTVQERGITGAQTTLRNLVRDRAA